MIRTIFTRHFCASLAVVALAASATAARANMIALPNPGTNFAIWDYFPQGSGTGTTFSNFAPTIETNPHVSNNNGTTVGATGGSAFALSLTSTMTGGNRTGGGARIYSGVFTPTDPFPFLLSIGGTALADVSVFSLQLKFTTPTVNTVLEHFTITLNNLSATPIVIATSSEAPGNFTTVNWTWSGLDLHANDAMSISITSPADHVTLDAIQVQTGVPEPVPEPATALSLIGGSAMLLGLRRRRPVSSSITQ